MSTVLERKKRENLNINITRNEKQRNKQQNTRQGYGQLCSKCGIKHEHKKCATVCWLCSNYTHAMSKTEWYADAKIVDKTVNVQLHAGARCDVISIKDLQRFGINTKKMKPEAQLKSYSGHVITM